MKAPEAPDPYETAAAQGAANVQSAVAGSVVNNFNEDSPYGSVRYTQSGTETITDAQGKPVQVPRYSRSITLSPEQQKLYDQQTLAGEKVNDVALSQIDRIGTLLGQPIDLSGLPARNLDYSGDRKRVEDALYSRLEPQFAQDEASARTRLQNQGLTPGSEAYNRELQRLDQAKTDARNQVVLTGGQEQSRLVGMNEAARASALSETLATRNQPINEITALMSGGQVTVPQFSQPYRQGVDTVPVGDYINQNYQNQLQSYQSGMSGLFGLGSTLVGGLFGLSDRRMKEDIRKVGKTEKGLPIYTYKYKGRPGTFMGVMAQDVEKVKPEAVVTIDGVKGVDYARVR